MNRSIYSETICFLFFLFIAVPLKAQVKQFQPQDALRQIKQKGTIEAGLQLISYKKKDEVTSKQDIDKTIEELFNNKYFHWPVYNKEVTELDALSKGQLENSFHPKDYDSYVDEIKEKITPYLEKRMEVGDTVFEVKWKLKGETFTSLAIFSPNQFVYEHMLANIIKTSGKYIYPNLTNPFPKRSLNYNKADSSSQK